MRGVGGAMTGVCACTRPSLHPPPPSPIFTATTTHPPYHHFSFAIHTHQPHCSTPNPTTNMNQNYTFFFLRIYNYHSSFWGGGERGGFGIFFFSFFLPERRRSSRGGGEGRFSLSLSIVLRLKPLGLVKGFCHALSWDVQ